MIGYGDPEEEADPPPGFVKALPLPEHLGMFKRRVSKVDIDVRIFPSCSWARNKLLIQQFKLI